MSRKTTVKELVAGKPLFRQDEKILKVFFDKHVLVTGAMGSLGMSLYHKLHFNGAKVVGIDHNEQAVADYKLRLGHMAMPMIVGDFADLITYPFDYVFHCGL